MYSNYIGTVLYHPYHIMYLLPVFVSYLLQLCSENGKLLNPAVNHQWPYITGRWFQPIPLKNDGVSNSWDDDIPNMMGKS